MAIQEIGLETSQEQGNTDFEQGQVSIIFIHTPLYFRLKKITVSHTNPYILTVAYNPEYYWWMGEYLTNLLHF